MPRAIGESKIIFKDQSCFKYFSKDEGCIGKIIEKSLAFHQLEQTSFIFPRVKSYNLHDRYIEYEALRDITNIREIYISYMRGDIPIKVAKKIFSDVGRSLAEGHNLLNLNTKDPILENQKFKFITSNKKINFKKNNAFLHLDFGFSNIFLGSENKICIIDPYANNYTASNIVNAWGPIEFDLATFLMCLEGLIPFKNLIYLSKNKIDILQYAFLEGYYNGQSHLNVDSQLLEKLSKIFLDVYLSSRYGSIVGKHFLVPFLNSIKSVMRFIR